ncbi:hypothetical protein IFU25_00645 [Pantoea agglomerans]|uniref:gp53-like domain-containing protein n=1 Tax=Enterobacter agglomerans TaxID=549 RepID=UPI00177F7563|nr:hypothetical protein [Pantoea agglomerans]MBD8180199.1 hypothetical protein [Pantoea agglomerans]
MHRIDTSTAQKDKFGSGKNGFTGGNPQTGELPTALDQDFFDSLQEEICGVIEGGGIALAKADHGQLLKALKAMFPVSSLFGNKLTASGYQKLPGGLVLQWINSIAPEGVTSSSVALPVAFSNQTLIAYICDAITAGSPNNFNLAWSINTTTKSSISWVSTTPGVGSFTVLAIGF